MDHEVISHFFDGGPEGCLLLHGFSGSPLEMVPMAEALSRQGFTAGVAELAGHSSPRALATVTAADWLRSAASAYDELSKRCARTAIVGLSMGGAVALSLAPNLRPSAIVTISTPVRMKRLIAKASRVASRVIPYVPVLMKLGPRERAMRPYRSRTRRIPLKATQQVDYLLGVMREALPQVTSPVLIAQGRRDWVIPRESAQEIRTLATRASTTVLWLPRSGHVATLDQDRELLFDEVLTFFNTHLRGGR